MARTIPTQAVDPHIATHLGAGERVVWQGRPRPLTFASPLRLLLSAAIALFGVAILSGQTMALPWLYLPAQPTDVRLTSGLSCTGIGGALTWMSWQNRGARWRYAITNRRLISVRGMQLIRSVLPEQIRTIGRDRSVVYWRLNGFDRTAGDRKVETGRYTGFYGLEDAAGVEAQIRAWLDGLTDSARASAEAFSATIATITPGPAALEGIARVRHPETGVSIDVPENWRITVRQDRDGPLRLFGVTLLKRVIRHGDERPWPDAAAWTTLLVRGAPDAGLYLHLRDGPLCDTLDDMVADPWNVRMGLEILQTKADLKVGPLRGFSLARRMPAGANLIGFGPVTVPVLTRTVRLGTAAFHLEISGMAPADQPGIQRAIDAMIESITVPDS